MLKVLKKAKVYLILCESQGKYEWQKVEGKKAGILLVFNTFWLKIPQTYRVDCNKELIKALSVAAVGQWRHHHVRWYSEKCLKQGGNLNSALFYIQLFYFSQAVIPGSQRHPLLLLGQTSWKWMAEETFHSMETPHVVCVGIPLPKNVLCFVSQHGDIKQIIKLMLLNI